MPLFKDLNKNVAKAVSDNRGNDKEGLWARVYKEATNTMPPSPPPSPTGPAPAGQQFASKGIKMPPTKDSSIKLGFGRASSNSGMAMSAKVYHPATNLMPPTPPLSPTGVAPSFQKSTSTSSWGRQNSHNGKHS